MSKPTSSPKIAFDISDLLESPGRSAWRDRDQTDLSETQKQSFA